MREAIAGFIETESNRDSMITITNLSLSPDFKRMTVFVTVFPEHKENAALDFINRKKSDARNFLKKNGRLSRIPHIEFELDKGEKARQRLDEISNEIKSEESSS